jgi:hypothetical protein
VELELHKTNTPERLKILDKIETIKARMAVNPVREIMEAGVMQTIVEDIHSLNLEDGNLLRRPISSGAERIYEASPKMVQAAFSFVTMRQDSAMYTWANNAVKLSDFSARYALLKHLQKTSPHIPKEKMLAKIMSEFVDYDIPTARWIQYLNDVGVLWFTKYGLRSIAIAGRLLRDHPDNVAKLFLTENLFGIDIPTPLDFHPDSRIGGLLDKAVDIADTTFTTSVVVSLL